MAASAVPPEKCVGFIPHVNVLELTGTKQYAVYLTNRRAVFVLTKLTHENAGFLLGGYLGAALAAGLAQPRPLPGGDTDPDALSAAPGSLTIMHSAIRELMTTKTFTRWELYIEYEDPEGKTKKLWADVRPALAVANERQRQGERWKDIHLGYARDAQTAYRNALPPEVLDRVDWGF